jgi:hypothetical protein
VAKPGLQQKLSFLFVRPGLLADRITTARLRWRLLHMSTVEVGRVAGPLGMASLSKQYDTAREPTLYQLKMRWLQRLEERASGGRSWKWVLKECFNKHGSDRSATVEQFARMVHGTGSCLNRNEGGRLFDSWSAEGSNTILLNSVMTDLVKLDSMDEAVFANYNKGGSLDAYTKPGSKSKSNTESADSSLVSSTDDPHQSSYNPVSAARRNITAASPARPPRSDRAAGVVTVTGGTINNASSVPGGIFSAGFLDATLEQPKGGNKSNLPSVSGGIFEDHSEDLPGPPGGTSRSQRSSVPGGIFAPSSRPATVEYGYERFPRQGLA